MTPASRVLHCVEPLLARQRNAIEARYVGRPMLAHCYKFTAPFRPTPFVRNAEYIVCEQQRHKAACPNAQSDQCHFYSIYVSDGS